MGRAQHEEPGKPPQKEVTGVDIARHSPFNLDRDTNAEQKREDGQRFVFQSACGQKIDQVIGSTRVSKGLPEVLQQWDAEVGQDVDDQHTEQRETADDVDRPDALA